MVKSHGRNQFRGQSQIRLQEGHAGDHQLQGQGNRAYLGLRSRIQADLRCHGISEERAVPGVQHQVQDDDEERHRGDRFHRRSTQDLQGTASERCRHILRGGPQGRGPDQDGPVRHQSPRAHHRVPLQVRLHLLHRATPVHAPGQEVLRADHHRQVGGHPGSAHR